MATTTTVRVSEAEYREFALGDKTGDWELVDGLLREKPAMTFGHGRVIYELTVRIANQLDPNAYAMRINHARLRVSSGTYYVPDLAVIPVALEQRNLATPRALDAYSEPLPLVIEIWSPSTGDYDFDPKLPDYQQRGDLEIWYIHPYERTLTAWRRESHGTYRESLYRGGMVQAESIPGVGVDLDTLPE
jgi:Uma2 family endonuclease